LSTRVSFFAFFGGHYNDEKLIQEGYKRAKVMPRGEYKPPGDTRHLVLKKAHIVTSAKVPCFAFLINSPLMVLLFFRNRMRSLLRRLMGLRRFFIYYIV
jgi:hypothetical protein